MEDYEQIDRICDQIVNNIFKEAKNIDYAITLPTWEFTSLKKEHLKHVLNEDITSGELLSISNRALLMTKKDMDNIKEIDYASIIDFSQFFKTYVGHFNNLLKSKKKIEKEHPIKNQKEKLIVTDKTTFKIRVKEPEAYAVFICHAIEDKNLANHLKRLLNDLNIQSFVAHDDIKKGDPWQDSIIVNLQKSKVMVVIGTKNIENSPWVNFEVGLGYENMFPILFDKLSDKVTYIKGKQGIPVNYKNIEKTIFDIISTIVSKLGMYTSEKEESIKSYASFRNLEQFIQKNYSKK